jgi:hypothetical protein
MARFNGNRTTLDSAPCRQLQARFVLPVCVMPQWSPFCQLMMSYTLLVSSFPVALEFLKGISYPIKPIHEANHIFHTIDILKMFCNRKKVNEKKSIMFLKGGSTCQFMIA